MIPRRGISKKNVHRITLILLFYGLFVIKAENPQVPTLEFTRNIETFSEPEIPENSRMLASTSPSLGQVLGSTFSNAFSIALSQDDKTAFVSVYGTGYLEVIDITDIESPVLLATLKLFEIRWKAVALSPDGKTLFLTDSRSIEIVDVTNREQPTFLGSYIEQYNDYYVYYRPSLVVSGDGNTLFVGGTGLRIFDVTDRVNPSKILLERSLWTTVLLSHDKKTLFLADKTMRTYDISDPKSIKLLSASPPFNAEETFYTIILSKDEKTLYAISVIANFVPGQSTTLDIFDVTDVHNPIKKTSKICHFSVINQTGTQQCRLAVEFLSTGTC